MPDATALPRNTPVVVNDDHGRLSNDQELSKEADATRHPERLQLDCTTGTWEFMSIPALWTPTKRLIVEDELESFFNVLLYLAVRFLPHDCERVPELVRMYFEDCSSFSSHHPGPGTFKILSLTAGRIPLGLRSLTFTGAGRHSHPLNFILSTILGWFQAFYDSIPVEKEPVVFSTSEPHQYFCTFLTVWRVWKYCSQTFR